MANQNINDMSVTWNDGATTFDAIKMNVTDTASASGSRLFNLSVGGSLYYEATLERSFNIYNTYTDPSNYERLAIKWDTNEATITTEEAGTGSARAITIDSGDELKFNHYDDFIFNRRGSNLFRSQGTILRVESNVSAFRFLNVVIEMGSIPTTDPVNAGQLWNDSGTLKVSAG